MQDKAVERRTTARGLEEVLHEALILSRFYSTPISYSRGWAPPTAQRFPRVLFLKNSCARLFQTVGGGGNQRHQAGSRNGGA